MSALKAASSFPAMRQNHQLSLLEMVCCETINSKYINRNWGCIWNAGVCNWPPPPSLVQCNKTINFHFLKCWLWNDKFQINRSWGCIWNARVCNWPPRPLPGAVRQNHQLSLTLSRRLALKRVVQRSLSSSTFTITEDELGTRSAAQWVQSWIVGWMIVRRRIAARAELPIWINPSRSRGWFTKALWIE